MQSTLLDGPLYSKEEFSYLEKIVGNYDGLRITEMQLSKPEPSLVWTIFCAYLQSLQLDLAFILEPQPQPSMLVSNQIDAYQDAISQFNVFLMIKHILERCSFNDFSLSDLWRPKPKKLSTIIKILYEFALHFDYVDPLFMSKARQLVNFGEYICQLKEKAVEMEEVLSERKFEALRNMELTKQIATETKTVLSQIESLKNTKAQVIHQMHEAKKRVTDKMERLASMKAQSSLLHKEISRLNELVVKSPEKIKSELDQITRNLQYHEEEQSSLIKENESHVRYIYELELIQKELEKIHNIVDNISLSILPKLIKNLSEVDGLKMNEDKLHQELKSLKIQLQSHMSNLECREHYILDLKDNLKKRVENDEKLREQIKESEHEARNELDKTTMRFKQVTHRLDECKKLLEIEKIQNVEQMEFFTEYFQEIKSKFLQMIESLNTRWIGINDVINEFHLE